VNNNYNSNTVVKQDFAVVKQVDGRAARMTDTTRHQSWQSPPPPPYTAKNAEPAAQQDWTMFCCPRCSHSTILNSTVEPESGVTILFNIVDNYENVGCKAFVQSCFHQYYNNLSVFTRVPDHAGSIPGIILDVTRIWSYPHVNLHYRNANRNRIRNALRGVACSKKSHILPQWGGGV
jgi:hypothetical protein